MHVIISIREDSEIEKAEDSHVSKQTPEQGLASGNDWK